MALAALSVNVNNIITTPVYSVFIILDAVLLLYTLIIIIQSQISQVEISETWLVESYLYNMPRMDLLFIQIALVVA